MLTCDEDVRYSCLIGQALQGILDGLAFTDFIELFQFVLNTSLVQDVLGFDAVWAGSL